MIAQWTPPWISAHYSDLLAFLSLVLAVISLYYAIKAVKDGRELVATMRVANENGNLLAKRLESIGEDAVKHSQRLEEQTDGLRRISKSLSTRYLGHFPDYLPKVAEVTSHATNRLHIMCSVIAHGNFTAPEHWVKVKRAVEDASGHDTEIRLITYTDERRQRQFTQQYPDFLENWDEARLSESRSGALARQFLKKYKIDPKAATRERFFELVDSDDQDALKHEFRSALVCRTEETINVYMWVADESEAVFALSTHTERGLVQAFYTRDSGIVASLLALFDKVWQDTERKAGTAVLQPRDDKGRQSLPHRRNSEANLPEAGSPGK